MKQVIYVLLAVLIVGITTLGCISEEQSPYTKLTTKVESLDRRIQAADAYYQIKDTQTTHRLETLDSQLRQLIYSKANSDTLNTSGIYVNMDVYDSSGKLIGHVGSASLDTAVRCLEAFK